MPLDWQTRFLPFTRGLAGKVDPRSLQAPDLAVCRDAVFTESGGMQTRKPFAALGAASSFEDGRRIVVHGDELLLFTKDTLYSWSERDGEWISKATYLAAKVTETPAFARTTEQTQCDRAELDGVTLYTWLDTGAAAVVYVAAADTATGAVLLAPTAMEAGSSRPRLVALDSKVLLFYIVNGSTALKVVSLDPDDLATSAAAAATSVSTAANLYYDATRIGVNAVVAWRRSVTTSYSVATINAATTTVISKTPARTCDGPIAVAVPPTGTRVQVIRANGTNIQGDLLDNALGDVFTAQAVGTVAATTVYQVTAAYRDTTDSGAHRCYAFWHSQETASGTSSFLSKRNWVNTSGTLGTQANLIHRLGVASRAFAHDGHVFVWLAFAGESSFSGAGTPGLRGQLQNTYFLYRDDDTPFLVAKAAAGRAGGFATIGHLPNVQSTADSVFTWAGAERRIIPLGGNKSGYSARAPLAVTVEFDSDDARRTARLGRTLYLAGGEILQYDGTGLYEVGFHIYPWSFGAIEAASTGAVEAGVYTLKCTERWDNALGERDRSTTATSGDIEVTVGDTIQIVSWYGLNVTHKMSSAAPPCREVWRTNKNPTVDAPFFLTTSNDPSVVTGPNCFVPNVYTGGSLTAWQDDLIDADIAKLETNPENGGLLERLAPPSASIIAATQDRLFLAGIAHAPNQVWYSHLRGESEVAAFHDTLIIDLPAEGGPITALAFLDETLIVFKGTAIYAVPGDGFDNASGGQNYGPPRRLSADVGALSAEAVGDTPAGLFFKSAKGWYLLPRGGVPQYIGGQVADFDDDEVAAVTVLEAEHQIRCLTAERLLMFDYIEGQWSEWTIAGGIGAIIRDGAYAYATSTDLLVEGEHAASDYGYGIDVETAWIPMAELQGYGSIRWIMPLGEYRSSCSLRVRIAYNLNESDADGPTWVDDKFFLPSPATVGAALQLRHGPKYRKCSAIKVRLTACSAAADGNPPTSGEALKLTGLSLELGFKRGLYRGLPAAQKQ